jgi:2-polyprenyl-6-methoxyphenol hydroxylase-like FAD-dependent oxidoreductase
MPRWWSGRVCLLGDAAHAMSPSAGQGASLAIEDAQMLVQCLRDAPDPARAFALFERLRRPRVDAMFAAARRNGSGKAPSPAGAWIRDRLLPLFVPLAGRAQSRSYAYRLDWEQRLA